MTDKNKNQNSNYNSLRAGRGRTAFNSIIQLTESASDISPEDRADAIKRKMALIKKTRKSL